MDPRFSSEGHPEYALTYYEGPQGAGTAWMHRSVERYWKNPYPKGVLEVGFGSGEHLPYHRLTRPAVVYGLDPEPSNASGIVPDIVDLRLVKASGEDMPLPDNSIDRVVMTCVLAHVDSPARVCEELARVLAPDGEASIALPTDPGFINQLVKNLVTYRKLKALGVEDPRFFYAMQHRHAINNILAIIDHTFGGVREDGKSFRIKIHHLPFRIPSWNLNPLCIAHIQENSASGDSTR